MNDDDPLAASGDVESCDPESSAQQLAEMKMPLIGIDYRTYFDAQSRNIETYSRLRQWEITLLAATVTLAGKESTSTFPLLLTPIIVAGAFWFLEAEVRLRMRRVQARAEIVEARLNAGTLSEFTEGIRRWEFANTLRLASHRDQSQCEILGFLKSRSVLLFHGPMLLIAAAICWALGNSPASTP
jgi:hypothetical protein